MILHKCKISHLIEILLYVERIYNLNPLFFVFSAPNYADSAVTFPLFLKLLYYGLSVYSQHQLMFLGQIVLNLADHILYFE